MSREIGLEWGFAQAHEVTSRPMTREEYNIWFNKNQATTMLAFSLMENLVRLEVPEWELDVDTRRPATWVD